jgi:hypothetical protein
LTHRERAKGGGESRGRREPRIDKGEQGGFASFEIPLASASSCHLTTSVLDSGEHISRIRLYAPACPWISATTAITGEHGRGRTSRLGKDDLLAGVVGR